MKKNLLPLFSAACLLAFTLGCYSTLDGRMRMGTPMGKDTIEGRYQRSVDEIFKAAKDVLSFNGTLYGENTISKTLEAKIDTRTVWVAVDEVEPKVSRVRVQARKKGGTSDVDLASEIEKQIALRLPR
ncbi:MAG: hypothetical protein HY735_04460 [Verrucomicrobia bacterium]|nr:hypothetical protein [Verrucomicrobiota bacterium]